MHRLLFAIVVSLIAPGLSTAEQERLVQILSRSAVPQKQKFECPCTFDLGRDIDGETGLIIDHRGKGQPAFINIEGSVVRLENTRRFRYECQKGEKITASWRGNDVWLRVELQTEGPGEESCWFNGLLVASKGSRHEARRIVGACGC